MLVLIKTLGYHRWGHYLQVEEASPYHQQAAHRSSLARFLGGSQKDGQKRVLKRAKDHSQGKRSRKTWMQAAAKMAMSSILNTDDIKKALDAFSVADSFDHKKFFEVVGLKAKSSRLDDVKKVFTVNWMLDADNSGFIEEEELKFVLKGFAKDGRDLTDKETKAFLKAADKDGDGKIGVDEEHHGIEY
ncbi:hypothetical protein L3Q82_002827 [Scortum barcoo]|uniref:Uncharacterized protein n=1 Tax=Scortum barcoo TaxID=214431 RepID=A0ACB8VXQ0_9TELE|nr:hypothetical protein L3Q82_002827 [Scortum barcoo]